MTVIDLVEIDSAAGFIAAVDPLGLLKVGPRSAGSVPGPVCYDRGGQAPTVTDAALPLGNLDPACFLGGEMALAQDRVRDAIASRLAHPLGIPPQAALRGIRSILDDSMAAATRMHLAEQGKNPRSCTLFAFGGAGPAHAWSLARLLGIRRVVVPMGAGIRSARPPRASATRACRADATRSGSCRRRSRIPPREWRTPGPRPERQ